MTNETTTATTSAHLDRDEAIRRIKAALRKRSGKNWSVRGGRGTAWGWIEIDTMPARRKFDWEGNPTDSEFGHMSLEERRELADLLGFEDAVHAQGVSIAASSGHRVEYVDRAEGREPSQIGERYWD